jgi:hypothetical protein
MLPREGGVVSGANYTFISLQTIADLGLRLNEDEISLILEKVAKYFGTEVDVRKWRSP